MKYLFHLHRQNYENAKHQAVYPHYRYLYSQTTNYETVKLSQPKYVISKLFS